MRRGGSAALRCPGRGCSRHGYGDRRGHRSSRAGTTTKKPGKSAPAEENIGFFSGVAIGAVAGGPIGAVAGGITGALLGEHYHKQKVAQS